MYHKKWIYGLALLLIGSFLTGASSDNELSIQAPAEQLASKMYVSKDSAVNAFLSKMREFGEMSAINTSARFLQQAITTASQNVARKLDMSRTMISQIQDGLQKFDDMVGAEVGIAEQLRESLAAVLKSFEHRIRALEDAKGIKRGIFS